MHSLNVPAPRAGAPAHSSSRRVRTHAILQWQPTKTSLGAGSVLPNLYWTAMPISQLRGYHVNYHGLPAPEDVLISGDDTFKYMRQHTPLWQELHQGRLTTGKFSASLGLLEHRTARAVGAIESQGAVVNAYHHLMSPSPQLVPRGEAAQESGEGNAIMHNEAARQRLHQAKLPQSRLPPDGLWEPESKRRVCEQLGLQGMLACRLHWGNVQEGAALHALGQVFPNSVIEEVGMFSVGPSHSSVTSTYQIDMAELPPLGASPDGLIRHSLPITAQQIQTAHQQLIQGPDQHVQGALDAAARAAALKLLLGALAELELGGPIGAVADDTHDHDRSPDGNGNGSNTEPDVGLAPPYHVLLPLTYSNDDSVQYLANLIRDPTTLSTPQQHAGQQLEQQQISQPAGPSITHTTINDQVNPNTSLTNTVTVWLPWREAVEVKNHCPFTLKEQRKARHGHPLVKYMLREYEPLERLKPAWLPQLQLHCLATGTHTALLVSRTPSKGVSVFRVHRDDDYLQLALSVVRHVHVYFSQRGLFPPVDIMKTPELKMQHQAVINATRHLAGASKMVVMRPGHHTPTYPQHVRIAPAVDQNACWMVQRNK